MTPIEQFYMLIVLPALKEAAKVHGYALAFHGSAQSDLDLVAVPWTDDAAQADVLVAALCDSVGATMGTEERKPHGRRAWNLSFMPAMSGPYVDVSVMPRSQDGEPTDPV